MTNSELIEYILHLPRWDKEEIYKAIKEISECAGPVLQIELQVRDNSQRQAMKVTISKEEAKAILGSLTP